MLLKSNKVYNYIQVKQIYLYKSNQLNGVV